MAGEPVFGSDVLKMSGSTELWFRNSHRTMRFGRVDECEINQLLWLGRRNGCFLKQ